MQIIPSRFHAIGFVAIFVTSSIVPIFVKNLYDPARKYAGYSKRNLMDSNPKLELQMIACIYRSENTSSIVKLIDTCVMNKEMPIVVHALHLLTLKGQSAPVFISHGLRRNALSTYSSSNDVILAFMHLARNNPSVLSWNAYTAISPPRLMNEDICTLALDKSVSFIILPFHRIWTIDGQHIDDNSMRTLNCSILERAPCSLGILVDRGHLGSRAYTKPSRALNIAMIFFGGKDDREGLTLAKRMAEKLENILTIIRVHCNSDEQCMNWENMLDSEVLKDVKNGKYNRNVIYKEIWIEDGNHMIEVLRSLIGSFKLVIVGRRHDEKSDHTAGLEIWSEFPELGIVGDLLITGDFDGEFSVLVVKQQVQI